MHHHTETKLKGEGGDSIDRSSSLHFPAHLGGVVAVEEVQEDIALAPGALAIRAAEHHVHEALGAGREHHRRRFLRAVTLSLQRQARARRRQLLRRSVVIHGDPRRVPSRRQRELQVQVHLLAPPDVMLHLNLYAVLKLTTQIKGRLRLLRLCCAWRDTYL